jgi:hypothetical protein
MLHLRLLISFLSILLGFNLTGCRQAGKDPHIDGAVTPIEPEVYQTTLLPADSLFPFKTMPAGKAKAINSGKAISSPRIYQ